jgi:hypothetical protein
MDDGLGFRRKGALVILSADKHKRRRDLPRFVRSVGGKDLLLHVLIRLILKLIIAGALLAMVVYM